MGTTRKLLLVSHGFSTDGIRERFLSSLPLPPNQINVAIVPTASAECKEKQKGAVAAFDYLSGIGFSKVKFVDIEFQSPQILADFDFIFFSGGNPCYLLWQLIRTGGHIILKELYETGTYIAGSSAGAMIWGKDIRVILSFDPDMDSMSLTDFAGLNCIPFVVLPHANFIRQRFENYNQVISHVRHTICEDVLEIDDDKGALFTNGVLEWL